jgi:transcriptional regulator with XRE-family HTH domain
MIGAQPNGDTAVSSMFAHHRGGPTVLRIVLGAQLRRLRESKHITCEEAGDAIRASHSKISRMELGRVRFRRRDVEDLLRLYGVTGNEEVTALLELADKANEPGWWHSYNDILPSWFEVYIGLEEAASRIRSYEVQFVPGLLQTEDYARAVTLLGHPEAPGHEVERRVGLRMRRQSLLDAEEPPHFWAVVDEAALRRPLGGAPVMRKQLQHLIEVTELPNVTLQMVPFNQGGHAAAGGPFSILRFAEPDLPDVVYLEQLTSSLYLDKRDDVDHYLAVMERLCIDAEPATTIRDTLYRILKELDG